MERINISEWNVYPLCFLKFKVGINCGCFQSRILLEREMWYVWWMAAIFYAEYFLRCTVSAGLLRFTITIDTNYKKDVVRTTIIKVKHPNIPIQAIAFGETSLLWKHAVIEIVQVLLKEQWVPSKWVACWQRLSFCIILYLISFRGDNLCLLASNSLLDLRILSLAKIISHLISFSRSRRKLFWCKDENEIKLLVFKPPD